MGFDDEMRLGEKATTAVVDAVGGSDILREGHMQKDFGLLDVFFAGTGL